MPPTAELKPLRHYWWTHTYAIGDLSRRVWVSIPWQVNKKKRIKEPLTLECDYSTRLLDWGRRRVKKESLLILYSPFLHSYLNHTRLTFVHRQSFYFPSLTLFWSRFQLQKNNAGWCPFLCHRLSLKKVFLEFYLTSKSPSILRRSSAVVKNSHFFGIWENRRNVGPKKTFSDYFRWIYVSEVVLFSA